MDRHNPYREAMGKYLLLSFFMVFVMAMIPRSFRWTAIALTLAIASTAVVTLPSVARYRPPSNLQRPEGRQGAATRVGICTKPNTFALVVPLSNYGQTTAAYPTFYWFLNNYSFPEAVFELSEVSRNQPIKIDPTIGPLLEPNPIYQTTFRIMPSTTLASLTLPASSGLPPLKIGREYQWKLTLNCFKVPPEGGFIKGSPMSIQGWIKRVEPSARLKAKLDKTPRRYEVYAEESLWYDAIHDLAEQRQRQPALPRFIEDWRNLMGETQLQSMYQALQR
jgi:Domain of Unknown Function (DUF928)